MRRRWPVDQGFSPPKEASVDIGDYLMRLKVDCTSDVRTLDRGQTAIFSVSERMSGSGTTSETEPVTVA